MPLNMDDYDHEIGRHLRAIDFYLGWIERHVEEMSKRPDFETIAEHRLVKIRRTMHQVLDQLDATIEAYQEKPRDT